MSEDALDRLAIALSRRRLTFEIEESLARRAEAYHERLRERLGRDDADLADLTFAEALSNAIEVAVERDEKEHGLIGDIVTGRVVVDTPERRAAARRWIESQRAP